MIGMLLLNPNHSPIPIDRQCLVALDRLFSIRYWQPVASLRMSGSWKRYCQMLWNGPDQAALFRPS